MKNILLLIALTTIGSMSVSAQASPQQPNYEFLYSRFRASIGESEEGNVYDKRVYKTQNGLIVQFYAEIFYKTPEKAAKSFENLTSTFENCSALEDAINPRDEKVGKRTVCKNQSAVSRQTVSRQNAIIYTYGDILTVISGDSLPAVKQFESGTCVRSKLVPGIPCKY